jgi:hypothetical protein
MNEEQLQSILANPAVSTQQRIRAVQKAGTIPVEHLEADLVQTIGKPLAEIEYLDVFRFCTDRGWKQTRPLYDKWLTSHFRTEAGIRDLERAALSLRDADLNEWSSAMEEWKETNWKQPARLLAILELIADSPNRGRYHNPEVVEHAAQFLAAMNRAGTVEKAGGAS